MFVTFYSYKGGVGRSMALANIACLLAQDQEHAQRVLLWDFDLEAPGLHRLFPPKEPQKYGFVDLAYKYARTGKLPDIREYLYSSVVEGIDVLPAGSVDQPYCEKLQELHWPGFFTADPTDPGPFFGPLRKSVKELGYDYVLIDSRTGLNDQAGICTVILPDLIVALFRLTTQNLDGLEHVIPMIRYQLDSRKRSGVRILPIGSVVAPTSSKTTLENKEKAGRLFAQSRLKYIRFDGNLVTEERLFCLKQEQETMWPIPPVVEDYQTLCKAVRSYNHDDTRTKTERIRRAMVDEDFVLASSLLMVAIERRFRNRDLWKMLQRLFEMGQIKRQDTVDLADRILQKDPQNVFCYEWKGLRRLEEANSPSSTEVVAAKSDIEKALSFSTSSSMRLLRTYARIEACRGDLQSAVRTARVAQERSRENVQINFDLAFLHMRMGANYFSSAIDALQEIRNDVIPEKHLWLAYLYAFLGEPRKADESFGTYQQSDRAKYADLCRAHFFLLQGRRSEAIQIARSNTEATNIKHDLSNWAELLICAEDFDSAMSLLGASRAEPPKEEDAALLVLCKYLEGSPEPTDDQVIKAWQDYIGWGFMELTLFRERVKREAKVQLADRLSVVERLIQYQDLASLGGRGTVYISGTTGVRHLATKVRGSLGRLFF